LLKYTRTESASRDYVTHPFEEIASILVPPLINAVFAEKSWTVDSVCQCGEEEKHRNPDNNVFSPNREYDIQYDGK
jgi:hypothetical protein